MLSFSQLPKMVRDRITDFVQMSDKQSFFEGQAINPVLRSHVFDYIRNNQWEFRCTFCQWMKVFECLGHDDTSELLANFTHKKVDKGFFLESQWIPRPKWVPRDGSLKDQEFPLEMQRSMTDAMASVFKTRCDFEMDQHVQQVHFSRAGDFEPDGIDDPNYFQWLLQSCPEMSGILRVMRDRQQQFHRVGQGHTAGLLRRRTKDGISDKIYAMRNGSHLREFFHFLALWQHNSQRLQSILRVILDTNPTAKVYIHNVARLLSDKWEIEGTIDVAAYEAEQKRQRDTAGRND